MKKLPRLLAILLCFPLLGNLFMAEDERPQREERMASTAGFSVIVETQNGSYCYDPEEVLPFMMASMLADQKGEELCRAAAVICRTNLVYKWQQENRPGQLILEDTGMACRDEITDHMQQAAADTVGIVLTYGGEVIPAPFFYMSSGKTRDTGLPFLKSVDCSDNLYDKEYLLQYHYRKKDFYARIKEISGWKFCNSLQDMELERDDSGYVKVIHCTGEEMVLTADALCQVMELRSPDFDWEEQENLIMIRTRGIGHGIGFDVCYGARLDAQGMEYRQILEYFYKDIMLDKRYNACE